MAHPLPTSSKTTCPYCGVGCGIIASLEEDGSVTISGDADHPANYGRLCSKGAALADTLGLEDRLLTPVVDKQEVSWDDALTAVSDRLQSIIKKHGNESFAMYVSGQLLTEDYYVANKFMKGYIGTANIDTNSRLCMASAVAGYKRAFGSDSVPGCYEDLERAKLIVLTGSNTAWCHPVIYQRIVKAKKDNPDLMVVVIDPRKTATTEIADVHLAIKPASDAVLFSGLLVYLEQHEEGLQSFIDHSTEGLEQAMKTATQVAPDLATVADHCGLSETELESFYRLFARSDRVVTLFSQGINQHSNGTDKVNSIINCHLYTGRIGRPGMGPFSITGQPNAMGGREVGGLANQLTAHMELNNEQHQQLVQEFWQSPSIACQEGLKAVDLFDAIHRGDIKAVWIMATNPAVSMPEVNKIRTALKNCELVIVSDCVQHTDTTEFADILLPALTWGEKDGTVTNSERRISRQRAFLPVPGQARPDWWIVSEVARKMGFSEAFNYQHPVDILTEFANLSGYQNNGDRDFDISAYGQLSVHEYEQLTPRQWPINKRYPDGLSRLFSDGHFYTPSSRARFISLKSITPAVAVSEEFPLALNTGRIRDQWHTMTRTGRSARLSVHLSEPFVDINPVDAQTYRLQDGSLARVSSVWGEALVRVNVSSAQPAGSVFIPIHWNRQFASSATVDALVNSAVDPFSGQPEFKHTPVNITACTFNWYGYLISRRRLPVEQSQYWSVSKGDDCWMYDLADDQIPEHWGEFARQLLCVSEKPGEWVEYYDKAAKRYRAARVLDDRLESSLVVGPDIGLPIRQKMTDYFQQQQLSYEDRSMLLSSSAAQAKKDRGKIICACFNVGLNEIEQAIHDDKLNSVELIGMQLKAGTNCGSCIPELKQILLANKTAE
jgi:assimilatory nitrate reductase catalytic subunit